VPPRKLEAARLFYHYLQKELLQNDIWLFQMLTARLVAALGIWLDPRIYEQLPIVVPYALRDPTSRDNKARGLPDIWGAPNEAGLFRDDNSLIKGLPRSLPIRAGASQLYRNGRIGRGFVAAHVWRRLKSGGLAARHQLTYSFVPNLVWLPGDVAALTDREGSFVQTYVQALSVKIYRNRSIAEPLQQAVSQAWDFLPLPDAIPEQGLPDVADLNFFEPTQRWLASRMSKINLVADSLEKVSRAEPLTREVISARYTEGLPLVKQSATRSLARDLRRLTSALPL
jgi:hypothetical protein